ncbi:hypothetical protein [Bradyrhizobium australiense]|uniref:Uncharacterized protein n=1 Tax=Bradyrhizobium australiense TaxID=2721161 RepID=A0A7Y4GMR4_9BRAD|nr:hypothetical protein [Bradyrhizobium australiense]NOJ38419.1 hypothetical protein [Bradyrhizobium australiense]
MNAIDAYRNPLYWAGVALGPAAFAVNQQTVYAITAQACNAAVSPAVVLSVLMALVAALGALVSFRAIRRDAAAEWAEAQGGRARNFMAWLGFGSGVIFALVIVDQLAAALMINPCLR